MWVDIIMDIGETEWGAMSWIVLAHDRDPMECSCEHGTEPSGSINAGKLSTCTIGGITTRAQLHGISYILIIYVGVRQRTGDSSRDGPHR
jgi:hypothetical protein